MRALARYAEAGIRRFAGSRPAFEAGGEGVAYCDCNGLAFALPAMPVEVVSTHGAGDEFFGAFAAGLARGDPVEAVLAVANAAAASLVATPERERGRI
ncbi:PfkB family carbohydrate kinase [Mesorhizobium sp. LMG 17147]|uniref:PfkB family carbohydrate kinase n=1 Tax=Mesorhizobium sp. LMG 17147 TaxID=2963091 RepID=UPI0020C961B2|nr:PfkB family carbohydrate kinase [Mesorhizobium sp. LMG 17147]